VLDPLRRHLDDVRCNEEVLRALDWCGPHRDATMKGASAGVAVVDAEQTAASLGARELTDPGGFLYAATNEASGTESRSSGVTATASSRS
jgi:hypothetical protein